MEFRLVYQGPLRAEQNDAKFGRHGRAEDKQKLRKHFHLQLRELWQQHPDLREQSEMFVVTETTPHNFVDYPGPGVKRFRPVMPGSPGSRKYVDCVADDHVRCNGNRFVPLVSEKGGFTCSLDILFLRRDNPGNLVEPGGDIDNRIKVLLDGLRMPKYERELGGIAIEQDEDPFFCLLEDDKLITNLSITTDRLITPLTASEHVNDVVLVIHATVVNPGAVFAGGRLV
jgi:hypothetical protein